MHGLLEPSLARGSVRRADNAWGYRVDAGLDPATGKRQEVRMAESLVDSRSAEFELSKYRDEYRERSRSHRAQGCRGAFEQLVACTAAPEVADLMAAFEASVAAAKESRKRHPTAKASGRRAIPESPAGRPVSR